MTHEHDYWRTASGALECACGDSRRGTEDRMTQLYPLQVTSEDEAARIAAFELDQPEVQS